MKKWKKILGSFAILLLSIVGFSNYTCVEATDETATSANFMDLTNEVINSTCLMDETHLALFKSGKIEIIDLSTKEIAKTITITVTNTKLTVYFNGFFYCANPGDQWARRIDELTGEYYNISINSSCAIKQIIKYDEKVFVLTKYSSTNLFIYELSGSSAVLRKSIDCTGKNDNTGVSYYDFASASFSNAFCDVIDGKVYIFGGDACRYNWHIIDFENNYAVSNVYSFDGFDDLTSIRNVNLSVKAVGKYLYIYDDYLNGENDTNLGVNGKNIFVLNTETSTFSKTNYELSSARYVNMDFYDNKLLFTNINNSASNKIEYVSLNDIVISGEDEIETTSDIVLSKNTILEQYTFSQTGSGTLTTTFDSSYYYSPDTVGEYTGTIVVFDGNLYKKRDITIKVVEASGGSGSTVSDDDEDKKTDLDIGKEYENIAFGIAPFVGVILIGAVIFKFFKWIFK